MAEIYDFYSAQKKREAKRLAQRADAPKPKIHPVSSRTVSYPPAPVQPKPQLVLPPTTQRASLMRMNDSYIDMQVHAAIRDTVNGVKGAWLVTYPAETMVQTILSAQPVRGDFIPLDKLNAGYHSCGHIMDHGIAHHLQATGCSASDPYQRAEIFRRKVDHVEKVILRGVFANAARIPRPVLEQNQYVVHFTGGDYDIVTTADATHRLHLKF